jgi:hypothetical protein
MVSAYLYTLIILTDFFENNNFREEAGFVLVGIIFLSVLVNLVKFVVLVIADIKLRLRKRRLQKYLEEKNKVKKYEDNLNIIA